MDSRQERAFQAWVKFLNPSTLRTNLILAALFVAAYELFRECFRENVRGISTHRGEDGREAIAPAYQTEVRRRHDNADVACALWLREQGVLSDADLHAIDSIHRHRNELAHDLLRFLATDDWRIHPELIGQMYDLVAKVDRWSIRSVELAAHPRYTMKSPHGVGDSEIQSGRMVLLSLMLRVALDEDPHASEIYEGFLRCARRQGWKPAD